MTSQERHCLKQRCEVGHMALRAGMRAGQRAGEGGWPFSLVASPLGRVLGLGAHRLSPPISLCWMQLWMGPGPGVLGSFMLQGTREALS